MIHECTFDYRVVSDNANLAEKPQIGYLPY